MTKLRQSTPGFHGDRVRLRPGARLMAYFDIVADLDGDFDDGVATVFLPRDQGDAIREACAAFNAVMDAHERGSTVKMLPTQSGHLLEEIGGAA